MREDLYVMWLSRIKGIKNTDNLIEYFGSAEEIYKADRNELCTVLPADNAINIAKAAADGSLYKMTEELDRVGADYISKYNKNFPEALKTIDDCPIGIYYKGILPPKTMRKVSMVGSRRCTEYGKHAALKLAGELAECGIAIVSGLATGVDAYAHEGALRHDGITIGVLGTAIDKVYPVSNRQLFDEIIEKNGCIISEHAPGEETYGSDFVKRNRLIAGLSEALVVVEAETKSGTSSTVDAALKYGRSVFAVPGSIFSKYSEGTNRMIRDGCPPVLGAGDILLEIGITVDKPDIVDEEKDMSDKLEGLSEAGKSIIKSLSYEPTDFETLAAKTGIPESSLRAEITLLEIRKLVTKVPGQRYILVI